jgi:hypothetical protein
MKKIINFEQKCFELYKTKQSFMKNLFDNTLSEFIQQDYSVFNCLYPYIGETRNRFFITYSDHYKANSGMRISFEGLHHPYRNTEDRGYLKGISIDARTYFLLRRLKNYKHEFPAYARLFTPRINKSKHAKLYCERINDIINKYNQKLNDDYLSFTHDINAKLRDYTDLSLMWYIYDV